MNPMFRSNRGRALVLLTRIAAFPKVKLKERIAQCKATPEDIQQYAQEPEKAYNDSATAEKRVLEAQVRIAQMKAQLEAAEEERYAKKEEDEVIAKEYEARLKVIERRIAEDIDDSDSSRERWECSSEEEDPEFQGDDHVARLKALSPAQAKEQVALQKGEEEAEAARQAKLKADLAERKKRKEEAQLSLWLKEKQDKARSDRIEKEELVKRKAAKAKQEATHLEWRKIENAAMPWFKHISQCAYAESAIMPPSIRVEIGTNVDEFVSKRENKPLISWYKVHLVSEEDVEDIANLDAVTVNEDAYKRDEVAQSQRRASRVLKKLPSILLQGVRRAVWRAYGVLQAYEAREHIRLLAEAEANRVIMDWDVEWMKQRKKQLQTRPPDQPAAGALLQGSSRASLRARGVMEAHIPTNWGVPPEHFGVPEHDDLVSEDEELGQMLMFAGIM